MNVNLSVWFCYFIIKKNWEAWFYKIYRWEIFLKYTVPGETGKILDIGI